MALTVDTSRALRTLVERDALVRAVLTAEPSDETHWIEWKSPPGLLKPEFAFKIAKAILGFANRSPAAASRATEGTAYLILGAGAQGHCPGVPVVDGANLAQALNPYLGGADGPRWSPDYVKIDGKHVLVITVEAPRQGDRIYTLHRGYEKFHPGIIFHRGISQTEPALPGDVRQLEDRLLSAQFEPTMAINIQVSIDPAELQYVDISNATIETWLHRRESTLDALMPKASTRSNTLAPVPTLENVANLNRVNSARFRKEVKEYIDKCRERLPFVAEAALRKSGLNRLRVSVNNPTDVTVPDVELHLIFDTCEVHVFEAGTNKKIDLPEQPRPRALYETLYGLKIPHATHFPESRALPTAIGNPITRDTNGNLMVIYRIGNVRPSSQVESSDVTLILDRHNAIGGTWTATSTSRRGQARGSFSLPVADAALSIDIVGDPDDLAND